MITIQRIILFQFKLYRKWIIDVNESRIVYVSLINGKILMFIQKKRKKIEK